MHIPGKGFRISDDLGLPRDPLRNKPIIDPEFFGSVDCLVSTDHFERLSTAESLRGRGIKHLFTIGLATDYCVRATGLNRVAEGSWGSLIAEDRRVVNLNLGYSDAATVEMKGAGVELAVNADLEETSTSANRPCPSEKPRIQF